MKKIIFLVILAFSLMAFAGPGDPSVNTPLMYKVYFKKLGFSTTSSKSDCVYIFDSSSGTGLDIASVNAGTEVGRLAANGGSTLPAGTYTHICGLVKNGFDVIGSTAIGCTNAAVAAEGKINIEFGGHVYLRDATAGLASTTCSVSSADTPTRVEIPTVGEDIHTPEGVTMTSTEIEFVKQLPSSFTVPAGSTAPTFNLSFNVTNTLEMVALPASFGSNVTKVAVFIQPPMPSVTTGS